MAYKIIAAMSASNRVIGSEGHIPWKIKEDFQHFIKMTEHHVLVMGMKTYKSLGTVGLKNRQIIVLTKNNTYGWDEATYEHPKYGKIIVNITNDSIIPSLDEASKRQTIWICGGAEIYKLFLQKCDEVILSEIRQEYSGDVFMPEFQFKEKNLISTFEKFDVYSYKL